MTVVGYAISLKSLTAICSFGMKEEETEGGDLSFWQFCLYFLPLTCVKCCNISQGSYLAFRTFSDFVIAF